MEFPVTLTGSQISSMRRKVAWRILPLVILIYLVAYLDRANVGFAKLRMAPALHLSEEAFGFGIGVFFIGYLILEIPGALLVERWSARKWFSRILVTWGLTSAATAFVRTPGEFNLVRFLLGVAEAGFFPGIIVYFTHWFPSHLRGRAFSGLVVAVPFSLALGAPLSALLLNVQWLGLQGWQWLFILEGLPAFFLGIVTWFVMTDRPRQALWLTKEERDYLEGELAAEARAKERSQKASLSQALRVRNVWLLSLGIFATNTGGYALGFWMPTTVRNLSGGSDQSALVYSGLYYFCGLIGVIYSGYSSDRSGHYKWHAAGGMIVAAVLLAISAIPGQPFGLVMLWLCLTSLAAYSWPPPFWALPSLSLMATVAAVSIGLINIFANLAGYFGNHLMGWMKDHGAGDRTCLLFLAGWYLLGGAIVSLVQTKKIDQPAQSEPARVLQDRT
jgi:ACS family tartrate transporter-like MFS transporter